MSHDFRFSFLSYSFLFFPISSPDPLSLALLGLPA